MRDILSELDNMKVIDEDDIITIKGYIRKKYATNDEIEDNIVFLDAVNKIIYKRLEGLPEQLKWSIKKSVIENTLSKNKTMITGHDIFNACITEDDINDFTSELVGWTNLNIKVEIETKDINKHLKLIGFKDISLKNVEKEGQHFESKVNVQQLRNSKVRRVTTVTRETKTLSTTPLLNLKRIKITGCRALVAVFIMLLSHTGKGLYSYIDNRKVKVDNHVVESYKNKGILTNYPNLHLPEYMRYKDINQEKLKEFLQGRQSILSKEPYFSTIISTAEEFNLNPIVLFSITGQEQGFVPESHKDGYKIANNPFNVYHSWVEYNTDINDASRIASRTVINLAKGRSEDKDPFLWIGTKYAEDPRWGKGVKTIFEELTQYVK